MATEKGVRRYIQQLERLGILSLPVVTSPITDEERFNRELGEQL